jgi:peptide/nickel transport system substrate-binding protein
LKGGEVSSVVVVVVVIILVVAGFATWYLLTEPEERPPSENLIIAQPADADILDPCRTFYPWAVTVNNLMYESLLTYDWDMNRIPMLAESWEYHEGGMFYEFKLRHGIKFHCGHPFTAEAVKYAIDRIRTHLHSKYEGYVRYILATEVVDDYTIKIYLRKEDRYILDSFATSRTSIVCPHCAEEYGLNFGTPTAPPCGTGPFKFKEWIPDNRIVLERFDDYNWGPERYSNKGPAYPDGIVFQVVREDLLREAMLEAGEVDFVIDVRPDQELLDSWENDPNIVLYMQPGSSLVYLGFNCAGQPDHGYGYENGEISPGSVAKSVPKEVRQAIAYAINENRLIDLAYAGAAVPANSWLADAIWSAADYQENMYPYDPERAREILENAGYGDNLELEVIHWTDPHYDNICTEMARQLENVGITLTHQSLDFNVVQSRVADENYNMIVGGYNWPLADMIWWEWHTCRLPSPNRFWWGDNYTDAIIDNTWSFDDEVALEALRESQRLIAEDAASIGLLHRATPMAHRSYVKGFRMHPQGKECWHFLDTYKEVTDEGENEQDI